MDIRQEKPHVNPQQTADREEIPILPRSAWNSEITKLRLTLQVKQLLDQQETFFLSQITPENQ
ncbi:MAG: hypothetical protein AAGA46_16015 [Cyanobacteria bacterium P01_F01_bin.13]